MRIKCPPITKENIETYWLIKTFYDICFKGKNLIYDLIQNEDTEESLEALFNSYKDPRMRLMGCMMGKKSRCLPEWVIEKSV